MSVCCLCLDICNTHTHTHAGQISMIIEPTICPDPAEIYDGQSILFNCTHYGLGANITWQRNGEPLSGSIESSMHISSIRFTAVNTSWNGSNISCHVDSRVHASTILTVYREFPGDYYLCLFVSCLFHSGVFNFQKQDT